MSSALHSPSSSPPVKPRIIIHGGAGNITRDNLPPPAYALYRRSLVSILSSASALLSHPHARALDVAVHAVSLLEDDPLFNAGRGAVFTRAGTIELEASVMVSRGYRKRGVGCMMLSRVKNPIRLAREMLVRGEEERGGGASGHCQLSGEYLEGLARGWGIEMCDPKHHWTRRRWEEHKRGLEKEKGGSRSELVGEDVEGLFADDDPSWDGHEYLPQGTVGAVVLDSRGALCVATSTGGLTNKLPGRIGDTPTLGAGFWVEEWVERMTSPSTMLYQQPSNPTRAPMDSLSRGDVLGVLTDCLPSPSRHQASRAARYDLDPEKPERTRRRAFAGSGTGNGDSFLRLSAVRTVAAMSRFSSPNASLAASVARVAGPGGELQTSAGDRWGETGEGEGGIIGIELVENEGGLVWDFNCGGMFRAWVDNEGGRRFGVFRDDE